jgi:hypothetical protein
MERLSANYGLWVGNLSRGEAGPLQAIAEVVLRDTEGKPPSPEVAVAHRLAGTTEWYLGNFELWSPALPHHSIAASVMPACVK